jgi:hypothetical protein
MLRILEKLLTLDRRVIFLVVFLALSIPIFLQLKINIQVTSEVQILYDALSNLSRGSRILVSCDYDPGSEPELQPMAEAGFRYFIENDLKFIIIGLWPQGSLQANKALESINEAEDEFIVENGDTLYFGGDLIVVGSDTARYGVDFINLGYQVGQELVIQRMGSSFGAAFPNDTRFGRPISEYPIMNGINRLADFDFIYNLSAGYPGTYEWVQFAVDRFHVAVGAGNTAVQAPLVYPYLDTGQLSGLLGGMKGGAEFEKLVGHRDRATMSMVSQTAAHIFVILFVVIGNVAYFGTEGGRRKRGA